MNQTKDKSLLDDARGLRALREELRLEAHLFKAEAGDKFEKLERRWREVQRIVQELEGKSAGLTKEVNSTARTAIGELGEQYRLLKNELRGRK